MTEGIRTPDIETSGTILCATRGGQGSRTVKERAVHLAASQGRPLVFLFVADAAAMQPDNPFGPGGRMTGALREEMIWTGNVLLRIARLQASRAGVDAAIHIRVGAVLDEVVALAKDTSATLVLLGAPRGSTGDIFDDSAVSRLARAIKDGAGVEVEVVSPQQTQIR